MMGGGGKIDIAIGMRLIGRRAGGTVRGMGGAGLGMGDGEARKGARGGTGLRLRVTGSEIGGEGIPGVRGRQGGTGVSEGHRVRSLRSDDLMKGELGIADGRGREVADEEAQEKEAETGRGESGVGESIVRQREALLAQIGRDSAHPDQNETDRKNAGN